MRRLLLLLCSVFFIAGTATWASALVVYQNTAAVIDDKTVYSTGELGEEITLAATNVVLNEFEFAYYNEIPDAEMKISFYENDGTSGEPSTKFYDSGWLSALTGYNTYTLSGLSMPAPDTFTWTLTWLDDTVWLVALDTSPIVGTANHLWDFRPSLGWTMDYSFWQGSHWYARFDGTPIPEPSTILLIGTGLVGLVGFRKKFKK
jgi:hypothetical protein